MPLCTIVEWEKDFDFERLRKLNQEGDGLPAGCLCRIVGEVGTGARVIEVWDSPDAAKEFAEKSGPAIAASQIPAPDRVAAFETAVFLSRGA